MQALETPSVYAQWIEQPVVLQVESAGLQVSLRGVIVAESENAVRLRVDNHLEIDVYKQMILAVEEEAWMDSIT
jgi:hypothetical protein